MPCPGTALIRFLRRHSALLHAHSPLRYALVAKRAIGRRRTRTCYSNGGVGTKSLAVRGVSRARHVTGG